MASICDCTNVKSGAHFHYDIVELKGVEVTLSNVTQVQCSRSECNRQHVEIDVMVKSRIGAQCSLKRTFADLQLLDFHLHECAFGRQFSQLANLQDWRRDESKDMACLSSEIRDYVNRLSGLISDKITCCSLFEFLELESHGLRKQSKAERSNVEEELNVPALTAARCVQAHEAKDSDELPLHVGDLVAVIDMPDESESIWWKGKIVTADACFKVGYFPFYCIELFATRSAANQSVLLDATNTTQSASHSAQKNGAKKAVLLKRGKLGALLRAFFAARPSRTALKQRGLLRDRVFGCDLSEYLLRIGRATPPILELCSLVIESAGVLEGIYRLSGPQSTVHRLRTRFDDDQYLLAKLSECNERAVQKAHEEPLLSLAMPSGMDVSATSILRPLDEHQRATRMSDSDNDPPNTTEQFGDREVAIDVPNTSDCANVAHSTVLGDADADAQKPQESFRAPWYEDAYSLAAVLRTYFRELPNPLFTYELYDDMLSLLAPIGALRSGGDCSQSVDDFVSRTRQILAKLPRTHYRTARALFMHLQRMARLETLTNMGACNLAIVWSPNLLVRRSFLLQGVKSTKSKEESLFSPHDALTEARELTAITEFFIRFAHRLFDEETHVSLNTAAEREAVASPNVTAQPFAAQRPRRRELLELTDAIRVQYPDATARDRLLEERFDALLDKYGKAQADCADGVGESDDPSETRLHISLPSAVRHDFEKELASLERDLQQRGRRVEDLAAARRRAGLHSTSFWKSLFAGSRHRDDSASKPPPQKPDDAERGKENKPSRQVSLRVQHVKDQRSLPSAPTHALAHQRVKPQSHSRARAHTSVQPSAAAVNRSARSHSDVRARVPLSLNSTLNTSFTSHGSQSWLEPPAYVNLPLARPVSLTLETARPARPVALPPPSAELVEFDREPSIRRSAVQLTPPQRASWTSSPVVPQFAELGQLHDTARSFSSVRDSYAFDSSEHLYVNVDAICRSAPVTLQRTVCETVAYAECESDSESLQHDQSTQSVQPNTVSTNTLQGSDSRPVQQAPPESTLAVPSDPKQHKLLLHNQPVPVASLPMEAIERVNAQLIHWRPNARSLTSPSNARVSELSTLYDRRNGPSRPMSTALAHSAHDAWQPRRASVMTAQAQSAASASASERQSVDIRSRIATFESMKSADSRDLFRARDTAV